MACLARLLPLAALACAMPAYARERPADVDISASPAADAIRTLGLQTRASIGYRDHRIAKLTLRAVRGRYTTAQTLERMLAGTGAWARRVAPATYVIELSPPRPMLAKAVRKSQQAAAEPAPPPVEASVSDIVVTATKRDVPLSRYPGGVEIIDGSTLSVADGLRGTDAIQMRAASVTSTHVGPGRNKLFIRGIADSSFVGPTQATVGQYWGNSRITYSAPDPSLRLYDVKSIEVLEGPQGTLYGAGSLGGVVRVVPQSPDLRDVSGYAWAGGQLIQHGSPGADGGAVLNLPLDEGRLGFRALVFGGVEGGYIDDAQRNLDDVNKVRTIGGRAALRFQPGADWTFDLSGLGQRIRGDDSQYADRGSDDLTRSSAIDQPYGNDYWLAELVMRKSWHRIEWTSSFGYAGQRVFETFEGPSLIDAARPELAPAFDALPAAYSQDNRIRMLTAETRLAQHDRDGMGWLVGASLLHNLGRVTRRMGTDFDRAALTGVRNQVDEYTLYGEGTIAPQQDFAITLGGRLTHSRLSGTATDVMRAIALRVDPSAETTRSETRLLPSAAISYRPDDQWTVFARYQQGFRPGGIAVRQDFIQRFNGDRIETMEGGARLVTERFETTLTASWTDWKHIQADVVDGFGFPTTVNIGDGRVLSFGSAIKWRPTSSLSLEASFYLNSSRVVQPAFATLPSSVQEINQSRLPNVADKSGRVGFTYNTPLGDGDTRLEVTGYGRYIGQSTLGIGRILGRLQGDYLDTGLEARIGTTRRSLSLSLTNLLDTAGNRFALGSPFLIRDQNQITPLQPRSIRLGFEVAF